MPKRRRVDLTSSGEPSKTRTATPPVRKRDPYILHACGRCRAAKVRCDGELPCAYCQARNPDVCNYSVIRLSSSLAESNDDSEHLRVTLSALLQRQEDKLDTLIERVTALESTHGRSIPSPSVRAETVATPAEQPLPLFQSSISPLFSISVIDTNLKELENLINAPVPEGNNPLPHRGSFSIIRGQVVDEVPGDASEEKLGNDVLHFIPRLVNGYNHTDPAQSLNHLGRQDIERLVHEYQDLVGMMYPLVDIEDIKRLVGNLWPTSMGEALDYRSLATTNRKDLALLKIMVAIALIVEEDSRRELAQNLYESLLAEVEDMIWSTRVDLKGLILLTLVVCKSPYSNN